MPLLVTASVDSIALSKRLSLDQDVTLSGQVVWTGRSALDIRMQLSQVTTMTYASIDTPPYSDWSCHMLEDVGAHALHARGDQAASETF